MFADVGPGAVAFAHFGAPKPLTLRWGPSLPQPGGYEAEAT